MAGTSDLLVAINRHGSDHGGQNHNARALDGKYYPPSEATAVIQEI